MSIEVLPFPATERERLENWLAAAHVGRWWKAGWSDPVLAALRAGVAVPSSTRPWRIDLDGRPIGYAQDVDVASDPAPWSAIEGVGPGTRRIELLIGAADLVNRKHGRVAIRALSRRLFAEAGIERLVAAPHPDHWGAIIAFQKAGFRERGRHRFPDGQAMVLTAAKSIWKG